MAGCPYRHFLHRLLGLYPLDDIEYEPDTWLEANQFGTLMHDVLQRTMEEICERGEKPSDAFLSRMREIVNEELEGWREEIPPPSETAYERRQSELLEACEIFLRVEEEACRRVTPKHFEFAFDDFALPLGGGRSVKLRGRIDRIDHDEAANEYHVWDYKSGSTFQFEGGGRLNCGTKIQHALYARAVEAKLGGRVTRSGYFFPTAKGNGARLPRECTDVELKDALNHLFDTIATGWFPHAGEEACKFCDFQDVCGSAKLAAERTNRKLVNNDADAAVQAWRRLQGVR
jgi:RecB family exonuclease